MRVYRRQKTLWRAVVVPLLDVLVLSFAALHLSASGNGAGSMTSAFLMQPSAEYDQSVPVTITIDADSTVYLDGIPTDLDDLGAGLGDALSISGGGHVTIEPAAGVPIKLVSSALAIAGGSGAKSFSLVPQDVEGAN